MTQFSYRLEYTRLKQKIMSISSNVNTLLKELKTYTEKYVNVSCINCDGFATFLPFKTLNINWLYFLRQ